MSKKIVPIKYTSRDYQSIKNDLVEHAKRYYENNYKDFNQSSFGSLMLDTVAYVGDILSFYVDYQANESFLETASEFENIIKLGKQFGYKFASSNSSTGIASFYISVPANSVRSGPDLTYAPILKKGSTFETTNGVSFILNEDVRFDNINNEIRVLTTDTDTGEPLFYAIKALGPVISGEIDSETISIGDYVKFRKIDLGQTDIVEIISVFDTEGNEYYQVENLSQNIIYKSVTNHKDSDSSLSKEILKPYLVPRRFVVDRSLRNTSLQFGASSDIEINNTNQLAEPRSVVMDIYGKDYITNDYFDPTKLLNSDKFGIAPSNTSIIVTYRYNNVGTSVNFATNALTRVRNANLEFIERESLLPSAITLVRNSLEVNNEVPLLGDVTVIDSNELKRRIENSFSSQGRAVTSNDYKSLIYAMPTKFGSVKRVNVYRDNDSFKRNLNIYVLCEDQEGHLTIPNQTVKNNIKTWIERSKMINDSIDILDGKVVNYSIQFTAIGSPDRAKYDILSDAITQLKNDFSILPDFGESIYISKIFDSLKKVNGLLDVASVNIILKNGGVYSDTFFDITKAYSNDKRYIMVPENVVMELKYPNSDIQGSIL